MSKKICCVCHREIDSEEHNIGGRYFCDLHFHKVFRNRRGLVRTLLGGLGLSLILNAIILIIDSFLPLSGNQFLFVSGICIAFFFSFFWLIIFYRLDTLEPEPISFLITVAVLGFILAAGVGQPLIKNIFKVQDWMYQGKWWLVFLASFLIIGTIQEYCKYAGVRFSIFRHREFDERVDGIIYGAAIGIGYALFLNLDYIWTHQGASLSMSSIHSSINTLAQAGFGGLSGYFLGRAKFDSMPFWWLPAGVGLAALMNALMNILLESVAQRGFNYNPLFALIAAACFSASIFIILFILSRRTNDMIIKASGYNPLEDETEGVKNGQN